MKLMTLAQLVELLNVRPKTIYDWTHKGLIPCVKIEGQLRFEPDAIDQWIKSKRRNMVVKP